MFLQIITGLLYSTRRILSKVEKTIFQIVKLASKEYLMGFVSGNIQKNQYAVMKMLWNTYTQIKVISASFPTVKTAIKTMLDRRKLRKEFCMRNNDYIKFTHLIRKDDLK